MLLKPITHEENRDIPTVDFGDFSLIANGSGQVLY
jgi:hypothetical protein